MDWTILEYETNRGELPITEFLKKQRPSAIAKISHLIDLLELHGAWLGMPHAKQLETNLYELRIQGQEELRILHAFKVRTIYLLHTFKKQTQKTPRKELEIARQRLQTLT